jgi:hypothetical protein
VSERLSVMGEGSQHTAHRWPLCCARGFHLQSGYMSDPPSVSFCGVPPLAGMT